MQRKPAAAGGAAAAAAAGGGADVGGDDPFGMHLAPKRPVTIGRPTHKPEGGVTAIEDVGRETGGADAAGAPAGGGGGAAGGGVKGATALPAGGGPVQRRADGAAGAGGDAGHGDVHGAARAGVAGAGGPLPHLAAIQASFGHHDVSGVAAHTDGAAQTANRAIGAEAYATGNDVAFAGAAPSLHTAAHEAAHVVQQRAGVHLKGGVGEEGDAYERHADAVADRVVAGESAADLLDGGAHGGASDSGSDGATESDSATESDRDSDVDVDAAPADDALADVQLKPAKGAVGNRGKGKAKPKGAKAKQRYEVELKAWIPHEKVVDPEEPARLSDWLDTISTIASALQPPGASAQLKYEYHSYYRGDNHSGYAGGHRVRSRIAFDWDGKTISGATHTQDYGTTHRDYESRAWLDVKLGIGPLSWSALSIDVAADAGTEAATATSATSGSASGTKLKLGISSANPVVLTWAPTIDSELTGAIDAKGNLAFIYATDQFPSHGIQVKKDGAVIKSKVVKDVSSVGALGPIGAINIADKLTSHSNFGALKAP